MSQALGVSKRTITNINKEKFGSSGMEDNILRAPKKKRKTKPRTDVDNYDADAIRNTLLASLRQNCFIQNIERYWISVQKNGQKENSYRKK